jgi:hypothetical protein
MRLRDRHDRAVLRGVVDDVAHALQIAIGHATRLRRTTQDVVDDAVALEAAIGRAVAALRRLQPRARGRRR